MRAAVVVLALATVGCRAVVGIDDLTLVDSGADATNDSGSDSATPHDSSVIDAPMEAASTCGMTSSSRGMCGGCCSMELPNGFQAWTTIAQGHGASSCPCTTCMPQGCTAQQIVCGGSGALQMMTPCTGCVSNSAIGNVCPTEAAQCNGNSMCKPWLDCMATCQPLPP